ncbi:MAG: Co2+/Mg2+ efflux protein ApaG [Bacteroidia bacterium]
MHKCITNNIEVSVRTFFHNEASAPELSNFIHVYEITITNHGDCEVKLESREWNIIDLLGEKKVIKGIGVVGEQPIIKPSQSFTYASGCNLNTELGAMIGKYTFVRLYDQSHFKVRIPKFVLAFPPTLS